MVEKLMAMNAAEVEAMSTLEKLNVTFQNNQFLIVFISTLFVHVTYQALLAHPLGPSANRVEEVLEDMLETNRQWLPQYYFI